MDVKRKTEIVKTALDSLLGHEEASLDELKAAFEEIAAYATNGIAQAAMRRAQKEEGEVAS